MKGVWKTCSQSCSVVFRRVRAYERRVAKIIVLDFWACSKNQHDFYRVLWPINGRMRGVWKACSTVWRACSVVFSRMKGVFSRVQIWPYDWTRPSYASHTVQHVSHTVQHASHTVQHAPHTTAKFSHVIRSRPPFCCLHITTWRGCGEDGRCVFRPKTPKIPRIEPQFIPV